MNLLSTIQQRYQDLVGQPTGTIDARGTRNINLAVTDVLNRFQFSWNITNTTISLSGGSANMPSDYNPRWDIDARIVGSLTNDDNIFTKIRIEDRDKYSSDDYVYWITFDPINNVYVFNSKTQTGTVTVYYNFTPTDMSSGTDVCVVPSVEAVAYQAASKYWIPGERKVALKQEYEQEATKYIQDLHIQDLQQGPNIKMNSIARQNLSDTLGVDTIEFA